MGNAGRGRGGERGRDEDKEAKRINLPLCPHTQPSSLARHSTVLGDGPGKMKHNACFCGSEKKALLGGGGGARTKKDGPLDPPTTTWRGNTTC